MFEVDNELRDNWHVSCYGYFNTLRESHIEDSYGYAPYTSFMLRSD